MTQDDVIHVLSADMSVSRETIDKLRLLTQLVIEENVAQNLIASGSEDAIWDRHILDSAQLFSSRYSKASTWLDVGTGAGFPGLVLAILSHSDHVLVEPRKRRAEFLMRAAETLGLSQRVQIVQRTVERVHRDPVDIITARAVASLANILHATRHLACRSTIWLLHKGRTVGDELAVARSSWDAEFEMIASSTDPEASIVRVSNLTGVRST